MSASSELGHYTVRGLKLAYHIWGDASLPPVILVHGFQDHGQAYARVARLLAYRYRLIAPDLRGHGQSEWVGNGGDYHFYDYFYDLLRLVDHLELDRFGMVGHSMGGGVATGVGAMIAQRVQRLVLLEGMGFITHDLRDTVGRLQRWAAALGREGIDLSPEERRQARTPIAGVEEAAERLRRYNDRLSPEHARELAASFSEPADPASGGGVVWRFDPLHKTPSAKPYLFEEVAALWRALSMPVLSLYGTESPWIPQNLAERHAFVPGLRAGIVEGAGHNLHHDHAELVARTIDFWMSEGLDAPLPEGIREGQPERGSR